MEGSLDVHALIVCPGGFEYLTLQSLKHYTGTMFLTLRLLIFHFLYFFIVFHSSQLLFRRLHVLYFSHIRFQFFWALSCDARVNRLNTYASGNRLCAQLFSFFRLPFCRKRFHCPDLQGFIHSAWVMINETSRLM